MLNGAVFEQDLDHVRIALISGPVQRSHPQLRRHEVDLRFGGDQNPDALHALLSGLSRVLLHALRAQVALVAGQVEGRVPLVVLLVDVQRLAAFGPLVNDPLKAGRVAAHRRLVDRQISIVVLRVENLIRAAGFDRLIVDCIEQLGCLVGALRHHAHEGELVHAHYFRFLRAKTSHN